MLTNDRRMERVYIHFDVNIIPSDDSLSSNRADLDFDVDDAKGFCADIYLNQAWVYGLVELSESGY